MEPVSNYELEKPIPQPIKHFKSSSVLSPNETSLKELNSGIMLYVVVEQAERRYDQLVEFCERGGRTKPNQIISQVDSCTLWLEQIV